MIKHSIFTSPGYLPVLGVGTVEIPTERSPNRSGVSSHGSLHLKQVLHVPDFICNVIGGIVEGSDGYNVETCNGPKTTGTIKDDRGKNVAYFDPSRPLFSIRVRDQPDGPRLGPHVLEKGGMYMLSCQWDAIQQQRWLEYQAQGGLNNLGSEPARATDTNLPYTDAEKMFLKEHWQDEYHFLLQLGLKIYQDEDRAVGRSILRTLMREDDTGKDSPNREIVDRENSDEEFKDYGFDFERHRADYNFSLKQLDWIEEYYGNSENFMVLHGLESNNFDDVEEAKAIVDAMMSQDDQDVSR